MSVHGMDLEFVQSKKDTHIQTQIHKHVRTAQTANQIHRKKNVLKEKTNESYD